MMRYQVLLEHDRDTGHWTASVPGIPGIVVDAPSEDEALRLVQEAIRFAIEEGDLPHDLAAPTIDARIVGVDV